MVMMSDGGEGWRVQSERLWDCRHFIPTSLYVNQHSVARIHEDATCVLLPPASLSEGPSKAISKLITQPAFCSREAASW